MKVKLTARFVQSLKPDPDRDVFYWDDRLGVKVMKSGKKFFVCRVEMDGRNRRVTLGRCSDITLAAARAKATEYWRAATRGVDLVEKKQREKQTPTFDKFIDPFLKFCESQGIRSVADWRRRYWRALHPVIGGIRLDQVQRRDVMKIRERATSAKTDRKKQRYQGGKLEFNECVKLIRLMQSKAVAMGVLPEGFQMPRMGDLKFTIGSRERRLSQEEWDRLTASIEAESNIEVKTYFRLMTLIPFRKNELLNALRSDVHFEERNGEEWATLVVPPERAKPKRELRYRLPPVACALLRELPGHYGEDRIFHKRTMHTDWLRIRERAGLPDVRIHDLRRSIASDLAEGGIPFNAVARMLQHKRADSSLLSIYARSSEEAVETAASKVIELRTNRKTG